MRSYSSDKLALFIYRISQVLRPRPLGLGMGIQHHLRSSPVERLLQGCIKSSFEVQLSCLEDNTVGGFSWSRSLKAVSSKQLHAKTEGLSF